MPPPPPSYSTLTVLDALGFPQSFLRKQVVYTFFLSYLVSSYLPPSLLCFLARGVCLGFFTDVNVINTSYLRLDESRSPSQLLSRFYLQTLLSRKTERMGEPPLPHFPNQNTLNQKKRITKKIIKIKWNLFSQKLPSINGFFLLLSSLLIPPVLLFPPFLTFFLYFQLNPQNNLSSLLQFWQNSRSFYLL